MDNPRVREIQEMLDCTIEYKVTAGQSLEKYKARYNQELVLLRIYDDSYYSNRFLREGLVLRQLTKSPTGSVTVPRIIDEWPEYQIRAIKWYEFESESLDETHITDALEFIQKQNIQMPFSLTQDLIPHLLQTDGVHVAYKDYLSQHIDDMLDCIDWSSGRQGLVHGDFHTQNLGLVDDKTIIYDWEYASFGSHYYDLSYHSVISHEIHDEIPLSWQYLAAIVHSHWYLQDDHFSPKEALTWIEFLNQISESDKLC